MFKDVAMGQAVEYHRATGSAGALPPQVRDLHPRMREIATIVYLSGGATAKDVQDGIDDPPTIYGIRTLLNRLVRKGVLRSRRSGRHTEVLYLPAIVTPELRNVALEEFLKRNFDGSVATALQIISRLV